MSRAGDLLDEPPGPPWFRPFSLESEHGINLTELGQTLDAIPDP